MVAMMAPFAPCGHAAVQQSLAGGHTRGHTDILQEEGSKTMAKARNRHTGDTIVIKKYANRRLYNTATSSYITLDQLADIVKEGADFVVQDAKSGEDITRAVLTQIIVEEESKGANLLPISFLKQLIGFYGDSMQTFVPRYLELSMESLAKNQEQVRDMVSRTFDQMFPSPTDAVDGMVRNNMAMMRRTMEMFYPEGDQATDKAPDRDEDIRALQERIDSLQNQLDRISRNKS